MDRAARRKAKILAGAGERMKIAKGEARERGDDDDELDDALTKKPRAKPADAAASGEAAAPSGDNHHDAMLDAALDDVFSDGSTADAASSPQVKSLDHAESDVAPAKSRRRPRPQRRAGAGHHQFAIYVPWHALTHAGLCGRACSRARAFSLSLRSQLQRP